MGTSTDLENSGVGVNFTGSMTSSAVAGVSVQEGNTITFTVTPSGIVNAATVLNLQLVGAAFNSITNTTSASDFTTASPLTFAAGSTAAQTITVTVVNDGTLIGNGNAVERASSFAFATGTNAMLNVSGGTRGTVSTADATGAGAVTLTGTTITGVTINSTGAANAIGAVALPATTTGLTINAATNLVTGLIMGFVGSTQTITVSGAAAIVNIGTVETATVKTINATGLTVGGVTAVLNATTFNFNGGAGQDIVTTGAVYATGALID